MVSPLTQDGPVKVLCAELVSDIVDDAVVLARPDASTQVWLLPTAIIGPHAAAAAPTAPASVVVWEATDAVPSRQAVVGQWSDGFRARCLSASLGCCIVPRRHGLLDVAPSSASSGLLLRVDNHHDPSGGVPAAGTTEDDSRQSDGSHAPWPPLLHRIMPQLCYFMDPEMGTRVCYTLRNDAAAVRSTTPPRQPSPAGTKVYHRSRLARLEDQLEQCLLSEGMRSPEHLSGAVMDVLRLCNLYTNTNVVAAAVALRGAQQSTRSAHSTSTVCADASTPPPPPSVSLWATVDDIIESVAFYLPMTEVLLGLGLVNRQCWCVCCRDAPRLQYAAEAHRYRWTQLVTRVVSRVRQCLLTYPLVPLPFAALDEARCSVGIISVEVPAAGLLTMTGALPVDLPRHGVDRQPLAPWRIVQRAVLALRPWYCVERGALSMQRLMVAVLKVVVVVVAKAPCQAAAADDDGIIEHRTEWVGEAISCSDEAQLRCFFQHPFVEALHRGDNTTTTQQGCTDTEATTLCLQTELDVWWHTRARRFDQNGDEDEVATGWSVVHHGMEDDGGPRPLRYRHCSRRTASTTTPSSRPPPSSPPADGGGGGPLEALQLQWHRLHQAVSQQTNATRHALPQWSAM